MAGRARPLRDAREEYLDRWSRDFERTSKPVHAPGRAAAAGQEVRRGLDAVTRPAGHAGGLRDVVRTLNEVRAPLEKELTPAAVMVGQAGGGARRRRRAAGPERIAAVVRRWTDRCRVSIAVCKC